MEGSAAFPKSERTHGGENIRKRERAREGEKVPEGVKVLKEEKAPVGESEFGRRAIAVVLGVVSVAFVAAVVVFGPKLWSFFSDGDAVRAWAASQGPLAPMAMAGLVCAQVVVAVLPGEPVELACGYVLGFLPGTATCLAGSLAGTLVAIALVRLLGMRVVRLLFPRSRIESVSWLRNARRIELAMFVVFLIPGTPKDVLTYVAGLADIPWWRIAAIATIGRIPSIVTSTLASGLASEGNWGAAGIVLAATAVLAVVGGIAFAAAGKRRR